MEQNINRIISLKIERTIENLKKNNMQAFYVQNKESVVDKIMELINEGSTIACGGSFTLIETGIIEHLRSGRYNFLDTNKLGQSSEDIRDAQCKAFASDVYLCSSNAITENGELYNVDGRSNRVAAMLFGPNKVIVVAGFNKIVKDINEATERVKRLAAPANAVRLQRKTPCVTLGYCTNCKSEDRICCNYVVMAQQRQNDRINVIIVGDELGY